MELRILFLLKGLGERGFGWGVSGIRFRVWGLGFKRKSSSSYRIEGWGVLGVSGWWYRNRV